MSKELAARADLPSHVATMIANFPSNMHPMTQFVSAISALQTESLFAKGYADKSVAKPQYWELYYEDSMNLIAKLPVIAASIFKNTYGDGDVACIDTNLDCELSLFIAETLGHGDSKLTSQHTAFSSLMFVVTFLPSLHASSCSCSSPFGLHLLLFCCCTSTHPSLSLSPPPVCLFPQSFPPLLPPLPLRVCQLLQHAWLQQRRLC